MVGKNRRHGSALPVGVSIPPIDPQRPSGRGPREGSAPNANRRLSAKAVAAVDLAQMVAANPLWRAPRIHGELKMLGIAISERTVSRLLRTLRRNR